MRSLYKRAKTGTANHITLRSRRGNVISFVDDERITTDPARASEYAIRKHQRAYGLQYNQSLFTIADYAQGHYLIYDNHEIIAYTIIT